MKPELGNVYSMRSVTRMTVAVAAAVVTSVIGLPIEIARADGLGTPAVETELSDDSASAASEDVSTEESESQSPSGEEALNEEQLIETASVSCPTATVSAQTPAGFTKLSGKVYKNFNSAEPFPEVEVAILDYTNPTTPLACRTTSQDGYYELFIDASWDPESLDIAAQPPDGATFTGPTGTVYFSPLQLPFNTGEMIQNISLGGGSCPSGQGIAVPTQSDPFGMVTISGQMPSSAPSSPKIVVVANTDFGNVCAFGVGGFYSVKVPSYWATDWANGGRVILTARDSSPTSTEGGTGGVFELTTVPNQTGPTFPFGPKDFIAQIVLNGGATSAFLFSTTICVLQSDQPPANKFVEPTRCAIGAPHSSGVTVGASVTFENGVTDLAPNYWQYIVSGPMGQAWSQWMPIPDPPAGQPRYVFQDVAINSSGGGPGGSGGGGGSDSPCSAEQVPTLRGQVNSSNGQPYPTLVSLWLTDNASVTDFVNPTRWVNNFGWKTVSTSATGEFEMCFDKAALGWNPTVGQIIAHSQGRGPNATVGDTAGAVFSMSTVPPTTSASPLELEPIVMAVPTIKGTVTGAATVRIVKQEDGYTETLAMSLADSDGDFATSYPVGSGPHFVLASAFGGSSPQAPYREDFSSVPLTVAAGASVKSPNLVAEIRDPSGSEIQNTYFNFTITPANCSANCVIPGSETLDQKKLVGFLPSGVWQISAKCYNCPYATTTGIVTVSGTTPVVIGSTLPNWTNTSGPNFTFRASTGSIKFRAMDVRPDTDLNYSATVSVRVNEVRSNGNYSWSQDQPAPQVGGFGWSPAAGKYRISLIPTDESSDLAETEVYVESDGTTITKLCSVVTLNGRDSLNCSQTAVAASDGYFEFALQVANFRAQVCAPGDGDCPTASHPTNSWAKPMLEVDKITINGDNMEQSRLKTVEITGTTAKLKIDPPAEGGVFRLKFSPPWGNPFLWATIEDLVFVDSTGWWDCINESDPRACVEPEGRTSYGTTTLNYPTVTFAVAPIIGTVFEPGSSTTTVTNTWVEIQKEVFDPYCQCSYYQWLSGAPTNSQGKFGFDATAGQYRVRANPPWNNPSGYADGSVEFEVTVSAGVTTVVPNSGVPASGINESGELVVRLRTPNVVGTVTAGEAIREFAGVSVEKWVTTSAESGEWRWMPIWGNTDETGTFRMFLEDGRWRLTAWPQGSDRGQFVEGRLDITISQGVITKIGTAICGSGDGEISCSSLDLSYGIPNVSGYVRNSSAQTVPFVGVGAEKWSESLNRFEWSSWSNGAGDGRYSMNLGDGLYRLGFNPPRSNSSVVRTNRFVLVDQTSTCLFVSETSARAALAVAASGDGCAASGATTNLDIVLDGPNVTGRVVNGSGAGQSAWVRAEVWNGQYFEWQDQWAEASSSGDFRFSLVDTSSVDSAAAIHRLTAEPRSGSGLSIGVTYIKVTSQGWQPWCVNQSGMPEATCPPSSSGSELAIVLPGANLIGEVKFNQALVTRGWVEVFKVDGSSLSWKQSSGLDNAGRFSLRLEADGSDLWTQYRVIVNPDPWANPNNLSKKRIDVWVGDSSDGDSARDEICASGDGFQAGVAAALCDSWISDADLYPVSMSNGNVQGFVLEPNCDSGCRVNQAELSLERWVTTSATSGYWQWTDSWTRSSSDGRYALQIDEAGDYRLTARPPWGTSRLSPKSVEFNFASASVSASDYVMNQHMFLTLPNISVTVSASGAPVANAWVGVERKVTNGQWSWWEWTGLGTGTTSQGKASLNIVNTSGVNEEYRLVVFPPWNNASNLTRFTQLIKITPSQYAMAWTGDGLLSEPYGQSPLTDLTFPTANLVLTVKDTTDAAVRDSWVYVEKWNSSGNFWQWIDVAGGTSSNGRVALTLTDSGSYRVVVNPPWNRSALPRFTTPFTFTAPATFDWSPSDSGTTQNGVHSKTLNFQPANVTGAVLVKENPTTVNSYAWVDVRTADGLQHVTGIHTNASGGFGLSLPEGSYSVWFFGNPALTAVAPTNAHVTVSAVNGNAALTAWSYADGSGGCVETASCTLDPVLERMPANLNLQFTVGGSPRPGTFVRLTDSSGARSNFVTNSDGKIITYFPSGTVTVSALFITSTGAVMRGSAVLSTASFSAENPPLTTIPLFQPRPAPTLSSVDPGANSGQLEVTWTPASIAGCPDCNWDQLVGFRVEVVGDSSKTCATGPSETSCVISGLAGGQTYSVVVRSVGTVGAGPASSPMTGDSSS